MNPRLSIIPAGAVTDRSLEPRDLQVLCLLGRHTDKAGWCVRSQVKMASEIDCGRSSVQRSLERLYEAGWVEKRRRDTVVEGRPDLPQGCRTLESGHVAAFEALRPRSEKRVLDDSEFSRRRLKAIEDRLAQIDGGPDADDARLIAYEAINAERRGTGAAPLGFKLK